MREEAKPTSHGTEWHHPPRAELRQEATARACGPWSRLTPTAPRTNIRKGAATHPAGACCAYIDTPQPMARRLRLLTHGLKIAHPLRGLSMSLHLLWMSDKTGTTRACRGLNPVSRELRSDHRKLRTTGNAAKTHQPAAWRIAQRQINQTEGRRQVLEEDAPVVNPMISSALRCVHGVENTHRSCKLGELASVKQTHKISLCDLPYNP